MMFKVPGRPSIGQVGAKLDRAAGARTSLYGPGINRKVVPIGRVNTSGTQRTSGDIVARIYNPSRKLSCGFSVAFDPDTKQAISSYAGATWTPRAMQAGANGGEAELHTLETSQPLPRMYELDSAIRIVRLTCSLRIPTDATPTSIAGNWVLVVEWEPNQLMCIEEVNELYANCSVVLSQQLAGPLAP